MANITKPKVDAVVVGMGWTGSIMAIELADAGLTVVGLERGENRDTYPDFAYPKTRGVRPPNLDERFRFGAALTRLAAVDPAVHAPVVEVNSLVRPQSALRDPELSRRVNELMTGGD